MEEEEKVLKYKVVQQIDIYKKSSFSNSKFISECAFNENITPNEMTYINVISLLSKFHEYNVIFPKRTTYYEYFNNSKVVKEDLRKLIIKLKSLKKILKMANIEESEISGYILFYEQIINLEASTDNMTTYNLNYDKLINILNFFHIKYKNKEFQIHKNSLKKIIEMCGINNDESFRYLNIYDVEERIIKKYNTTNEEGKNLKENNLSKINSLQKEENKNNNNNILENNSKSKDKNKNMEPTNTKTNSEDIKNNHNNNINDELRQNNLNDKDNKNNKLLEDKNIENKIYENKNKIIELNNLNDENINNNNKKAIDRNNINDEDKKNNNNRNNLKNQKEKKEDYENNNKTKEKNKKENEEDNESNNKTKEKNKNNIDRNKKNNKKNSAIYKIPRNNKNKSKSKNKTIIKTIGKNKTKNDSEKEIQNSKIKSNSRKESKEEILHKERIEKRHNTNKINDINTLKNNIYNSKHKNYNLLDFIDNSEDSNEEKIFERNYEFLKSPTFNDKHNKIKDKSYYVNTSDSTNNINNDSQKENINLNEEEISMQIKSKKKDKTKKRRASKNVTSIRKRPKLNYEIEHANSVIYLGSIPTLKQSNEIQTEAELIYPYNGYTKITSSFAIETPEKPKILITKKDDDYCYFPFILRKTPELNYKTIYLCGSLPKLGSWDPLRAIKMEEENRNGEEFFSKYIEVQKNEIPFEYKYFYYDNGKIKWLGKPFENYLTFPQFFESLRKLTKSHISIINLNIRYINKIDGINIWDNRKKKLIELLLNKKADIFLFQEITRPQSDFIDRYLSSIYEFVGEYRDSTDKAEKCSICVNKLKYTIIHSGQFWLSSTPYIPGSNDFGNFFPRICSWASLRQIEGISLLFMNVHLDHVNKKAHLPCIKVLIEEERKIENKYKDIHFVFIAGCFYCEENDEEIKYIRNQGFKEIIFENTYHGFTGLAKNHWDYMFWKEKNGDDIEFKEAYVMKKEGTINEYTRHYISDHFPIYAEFFHKNID